MVKIWRTLVWLMLLSAVGCTAGTPTPNGALTGRVLLWHSWAADELPVLNEALTKFADLHPQTQVVVQTIPAAEMGTRYADAVRRGLGPDLMVTDNETLYTLLDDQNLVQPLPGDAPELSRYLPTAVRSLSYQGSVYGLPLSLQSPALYYNRNLVDTPPATVEELLDYADRDVNVALNTTFRGAFWGIQAFGGRLFDNEGRLALTEGGFTNWLTWLQRAQNTPGMILSRDDETLFDLFVSGRAGFYVGRPGQLKALREMLGADVVGVTPLPAGPVGAAGPLLDVETLLFNPYSSAGQQRTAWELGLFLTNAEQNRLFMRDLQRVPANVGVRISDRAYPEISAFAKQARTAVPIVFKDAFEMVLAQGDTLYTRLLEAVQDPAVVTQELVATLPIEIQPAAAVSSSRQCELTGTLRLTHSLSGELEAALEQLARRFTQQVCSGVMVNVSRVGANAAPQLYTAQFEAAAEDDGNDQISDPDIILGPDSWLRPFSENGYIRAMGGVVPQSQLQRYRPGGQRAASVGEQLVGLPLILEMDGLYYRLPTDGEPQPPPPTLDDVQNQIDGGRRIGIPLGFENTYWGVPAYGGVLFAADGRFDVENSMLIPWLTWLVDAAEQPGFVFSTQRNELVAQFEAEELDYLVASSGRLSMLRQTVGDRLAVAPLPSGPAGNAGPLLSAQVLMFSSLMDDEQMTAALRLADFLTNDSSQAFLVEAGRVLPANVNVDTADDGLVAAFLRQVDAAVVLPKTKSFVNLHREAQSLYADVVLGEAEPLTAVCNLASAVNRANQQDGMRPEVCR